MLSGQQLTLSKRKCSEEVDSPMNKMSRTDKPNDSSDHSKIHKAAGVKKFLHGNIYQLKMLMLFAIFGIEKTFQFRLATEMDAAEKFDDLVFEFNLKEEEIKTYYFLQAKHKQDVLKKITNKNLTSEKDGDFCLQKYFISFRMIKRNPEFQNSLTKFFLCTNIGLDIESTQKFTQKKEDTEVFFPSIPKINQFSENRLPAFYQLSFDINHPFNATLKETSDIYILAKKLVEHFKDDKPLHCTNHILKSYHTALVKEQVILIEEQQTKKDQMQPKTEYIGKFTETFINYKIQDPNDPNNPNKLSEAAKQLRKIMDEHFPNDLLYKSLKSTSKFGDRSSAKFNPQVTDIEKFADEIVTLIKDAKENVIDVNSYVKNAQKSITKAFGDNINNLAGHVLIIKNNRIQFKKTFFDDSINLPGNLEKFKTILKENLKQQNKNWNDLEKYKLIIEEGQLYPKISLPNDNIEDEDIKEFFKNFIIAVNQPNENELSEIIKKKIGENEKFNLLDSNLVTDSFEIKMLDWLKKKEGIWMANEDVKLLFKSIQADVNILVSAGLSMTYLADLDSWGIKFNSKNKDLENFLTKEDSVIIFDLKDSTDTLLGAIKVYGLLKLEQFTKIYNQKNCCIFVSLKTLIKTKNQEMLIDAFKSSTSHNLLVIDCHSVEENAIKEFCSILSKINFNRKKRIILITLETNTLCDSSSFSELTEESKDMILKKKVIFQGNKISINKLIEKSHENTKQIISSEILVKLIKNEEITIGKKLKGLGEINDYYVSRSIFTQVIFNKAKMQEYIRDPKSDFIFISDDYSGLAGNNNKNVFDNNNDELSGSRFRELCEKNTKPNTHWLKVKSGELIWHDTKGSISGLVKTRVMDKFNRPIDNKFRNGLTENQYLEEKNCKIVIIADTPGMGKSIIMTSLSMKIKNSNPSTWVMSFDLNDYTKELYQAKEQNTIFPDVEVYLVVDFLINILMESQEQLKLTTKLEKDFLKNCIIYGHAKIVLFFDGFDEICPDYQKIVIYLLQQLKKTKVEKIFISTRPNMRTILEEELEVFSDILEPFSKPNQIEFLTKFWIKKLNLTDVNTEHINTYANSLIGKFSTLINDKAQEFIGIPLQTMMLAEVFQENRHKTKELGEWEACEEFLLRTKNTNKNENLKLPTRFNLLGLYEQFIKKKFYNIYLEEKRRNDSTKPNARKYDDENFKFSKKRHETMGLCELLSAESLEQVLCKSEIEELQEIKELAIKEGMIDKIIDNKPYFIHRTFAEYFASFALVQRIQLKPEIICSIVDSLVENTSLVFISSIANILNKEELRINNNSVLNFITRNKEHYVKFLNALLKIDYQDDLGKTSLHYAVQCKSKDIIEYVLSSVKNVEYANSVLVKFVNKKDKNEKTALDYAESSKLDMILSIELLLEGAEIDGLTEEYLKVLTRYMCHSKSNYNNDDHTNCYFDDINIESNANNNKFLPIQEKLLLRCPEVFFELNENDQFELLLYFFKHACCKVIKTLLESEYNTKLQLQVQNLDTFFILNARKGDRQTLLHIAAETNDKPVIKCLFKVNQEYLAEETNDQYQLYPRYKYYQLISIDAKDFYGNTPLHLAAQKGHTEMVSLLLGNGAIFNAKNQNEYTPKDLAEKSPTITEFMHKTKELFDAVEKKSLDSVKNCINQNVYINAKNENGNTPLHLAASFDESDIVKYLLNLEANVEALDINHQTPLHIATKNNKIEIVKLLLKNGAIFNAKDKWSTAPFEFESNGTNESVDLLKAISKLFNDIESDNPDMIIDNIKVVQRHFIIDISTIVNVRDNQRNTLLHYAAKMNYYNCVKFLLENGANFDAQNKFKETVISFAKHGHDVFDLLESIEKMFENVDYIYCDNERVNVQITINVRNNQGRIFLHNCAEVGKLDIVKQLVQNGADVNSVDNEGKTPLHFAAKYGMLEIAKFLIRKGAEVTLRDKHGKTSLQVARANNRSEMVKFLESLRSI